MSFFDELKKVTAQSLDPLGLTGLPYKISDDYEPVIDLGDDGRNIARAIALAIASWFTFGGAAGAAGGTGAATAGSSATGATGAAAGSSATGATGAAAGGAGAGTAAGSTAAGAAPIVEAGAAITPATTAAVTPATTGEALGSFASSLSASDLILGGVGLMGMGGMGRGGGSVPELPRTPFQRAPRVAGIPEGGSAVISGSDQSRGTTLGGTVATGPQGLTTVPKLGSRRTLG